MSNLPLYQINDWDGNFENAKSRTFGKCAYLVSPNKHGGSGWSNVMGEPDGAAIWGIWKMLLDICSRQRSPREGWLTADGKKNGRRLGAREISNLLRRPLDEILRALQVLQSPEVSFIQLIDGQPEHITGIPQGYRTDTEPSANPLIPKGYCADTEVSPQYPLPVSAGDTLRRKEGRKEPPIVPHGGTADEEQPKDTGRIPHGHRTDTEEPLQYHEAETWLNDLFGRKKAWQAKELHALSEILPIAREHQRLITWGYSLPRDGEGWALYNGLPLTKPKQSLTALLDDFNSEIDKWTGARRQAGLNGSYDEPVPSIETDDWTAARREAAMAEYGEEVSFATAFSKLPTEIQRTIDMRVVEESKK